ncbi:hypothetical protein OF83DRAFT_1163943 [Amylostereum chailletii]|nr:hypothetical protein OF83DRAFT_1163943 [Amylostereum chailletii]
MVLHLDYRDILPNDSEPLRRRHVHFNFLTVPLIGVLFLLVVQAVGGDVVRKGILGTDGVHPIDIMALFISLAYIAISLDATGLLRFLAFWVARKGGSSGPRLYFLLYVFFLFCGVVVGNDPVILSGTAFLAYLTRISGITPPTAWIFSQFTAANMASAVLVSSNPTNLVLSGAFSLSFITYTSSLILPFLAAALVVYPFMAFILFRSNELIPPSIDLPEEGEAGAASVNNPRAALIDKGGAIFGGVLLLVTLGILVGTSIVGVPVWQVTVPPAVIMLCRDAWHDWSIYRATQLDAKTTGNASSTIDRNTGTNIAAELLPTYPPIQLQSELTTLASLLSHPTSRFIKTFPTVHAVTQRLPIALIPFAFLMFILVQSLASKGWVEVFAGWWQAWVEKTGLVGAVVGMVFASGLLCNVCGTNIGTTILLARTLQVWDAASHPSVRLRYGSIYALAIGSNYGAFTATFSASLAGLLWRDILRQKGIHVRRGQFAKLNAGTFVVACLASAAVLVGQALVVH